MATQSHKWGSLGSIIHVFTNTDMSALANNALLLSAAINNVQGGGGGDGAQLVQLNFMHAMAVAATGGTGFTVWLLRQYDGTNYEAGGTSFTPLRPRQLIMPAWADTTQRPQTFIIKAPPGIWKVLLKNDGTGQALKTDTGATGSLLDIQFVTDQSV